MGFGDFYRVQREPISVYGAPEVLAYCGGIFCFIRHEEHPVRPFEPIKICGIEVTLFPVVHDIPTYGVRITADGKTFVYSCDTRAELSTESLEQMKGADLLLLDGIFHTGSQHLQTHEHRGCRTPYPNLAPKDFWCVHMSHKIPWGL